MEQIRQILNKLVSLSESDWTLFSSFLEPFSTTSGTQLLKKGQPEEYIRFISEGMVRQFIPDPDEDRQTTLGFVFEGQFVSAYDAFLEQTTAAYAMDALTDVSGYRIHFNDLLTVYQKTEAGNEIGRKIAEQQFIRKARREISLLSKSAEVRYLDLFSERPELIQHIPLKYVASYIGITPQALSRIRKRISQKN